MARRICDVCGVRPAVGTVRRIGPGRPADTLNLCEVHLAERRLGGTGSGFGGLGMFDDSFSRFFGEPAGVGAGAPEAREQRPVEQIDVTQLFSDATRDLLQRAAQTAVEWGSLDLDTEHLLHDALEDDAGSTCWNTSGPTPSRSPHRSRTRWSGRHDCLRTLD
jgi:ATP-dependent Clp protease ATP-binding subunit ClpC